MTIFNPGDFPIDPHVVDGVELANRLNRAITALDGNLPGPTSNAIYATLTLLGQLTLDTSLNGILEATAGVIAPATAVSNLPIDQAPIGQTTPDIATFTQVTVKGQTTLAPSVSGMVKADAGVISSLPFPVLAADGAKNYELKVTKAGANTSVAWEEAAAAPTAIPSAFDPGTRLVFAQASAPTGWTQIVTDTATNRLMRVVNTVGGGVGGTIDPTQINAVGAHSHNVSIGSGGGHGHNVSISAVNINHGHDFTTSGASANHSHSVPGGGEHQHNYESRSQTAPFGTAARVCWEGATTYTTPPGQGGHGHHTSGVDQDHSHSGRTGYTSFGNSNMDAHTHSAGADNAGDHSHSGSADSVGAPWAPRYLDVIVCEKN